VPAVAPVVLVVLAVAAIVAILVHRSRRGRRSRSARLSSEGTVLAPVSGGAVCTPSNGHPPADRPTGGVPGPSDFVLSATGGSLAGRRFLLSPLGLRIGRGSDNHVIVDEPLVSRYHAEIVEREGVYGIRDLGSTNGTYVDGLRVFERALQPGNRIRIGLAEFVFHPAGAATPAALEIDVPPRPALPAVQGRPFDGYILQEMIGGGGMAQVYRAVTPDGRTVAIKVPTVANDPYLMRKFVREGDAIGRLLRGHPFIVQVEHFGFTRENEPYIVMEYVDGGSLRERARQPLREEEIRRIVGQSCLALGFAHQNQIVHRDVKPENILLTATGQVKVADFGIARELSGFTVTHQGPIGTPEYMSPEQARGDSVLPASDVYSAGIVLYELLTGRVPFPRRATVSDDIQAALNVVERHISEPPVPPRSVAPGASPELEAVAMKAIEKKPGKRYKDGAAMAQALGLQPVKAAVPAPGVATPIAAPAVERSAAPRSGRLVIVQGPARGRSFALSGDGLELGRQQVDPDNTTISRRHAVLRRRGDDFWLEDLSVNGTWVNNARVKGEQMLSTGDCIRIADSILQLEG
jgi:serine/threonine protein kinase/pSer/pThr/pTyr-binding forkhead associated (FHA) protein